MLVGFQSLAINMNSIPGYQYQSYFPFIEKDLAKFSFHSADKTASDFCVSNPSKAFGFLYVLAGSKLGAKQICKCIQYKSLNLFFQSAITDGCSDWKGFTELTQTKNVEPDDVVAYAVKVFKCFIHSLEILFKDPLKGIDYAE